MQSKNKFYLLVCLAISNDKYHKLNNLIHLVSSIFYTTEFNSHFDELTQINEISKLNTVVLRVTRNTTPYLVTTQYNNSLVQIEISFIYLLDLYLKSSEYSDFVEEIFQQSDKEINTNILKGAGYKNILYVFEDLNWLEIQWLFKIKKVIISGGSISNRQYLSTSEFNLSLYLHLLGYSDVDIHESHNLAKLLKKKEANSDMIVDNNISLAPQFLRVLLNSWLDDELNNYLERIKCLEQEILSRKEKIQFSKKTQSVKNQEILSQNKSVYNSKRLRKIEINIREESNALLFKEKELSDLNTKLLELTQKKDNLSNLSLTELKDEYFKYVYNFKKSKDISTVKILLSQTKKLGSSQTPIIKRSYTTSSRQINPSSLHRIRRIEPLNNLISINKLSKKYLSKINQVTIRKMSSVYTNSLVSQKLLEIIHSNDNKENIQLKIENYLISERSAE